MSEPVVTGDLPPGVPSDAIAVGDVTRVFSNLKVAGVKIRDKESLIIGDTIYFARADTDTWDSTEVESIEFNCKPVKVANADELVGVLVGAVAMNKTIIYRMPR